MNLARLPALTLLVTLLCATASASRAEIGTWTNLDGQQMEAEFQGRQGDQISFKKADGSRYTYPYAKLAEADRARIDAAIAAGFTPPPEPSATPPAPPPKAGTVPAALAGKLVQVKGSRLAPVPRDQLTPVRHIAFYYSAQWCPPCRAFTPTLVESYKKLKAKHPDFELIFVSSDRSEDEMKEYMKGYDMPWPALEFDAKKSTSVVKRPANERGIPNLVFMDAEGKELSLSYTPEGEYRGPRAVLRDIEKQLGL